MTTAIVETGFFRIISLSSLGASAPLGRPDHLTLEWHLEHTSPPSDSGPRIS